MSLDPALPPWLIIVHRDEEQLYHNLRQAFESDPRVTVIRDRRRADRREQTVPMPTERRRSDRRRPLTVEAEKIWQSLRFRLIHRDQALTVYQATGEPLQGTRRARTGEGLEPPLATRAVERRRRVRSRPPTPPRPRQG